MDASSVVGIDLGTKYVMAAYCPLGEEPRLIPNRWGDFKTPSLVCLDDGQWYVGEEARRREFKVPNASWWDIKRKLSTDWAPVVDGVVLSAQDILTPLLSQVREDCEAYLGQIVLSSVISVPAHFSFLERSAIARVARSAGFEDVRIVNEPTAAAMACSDSGRVLVVDFGAGTFDVSVLEVEGATWQVLESVGDSSVGGEEVDLLLARWIISYLGGDYNYLSSSLKRLLLLEAEQIKKDLSFRDKVRWAVPPYLSNTIGEVNINRSDLERLITPLVNKSLMMVSDLWLRHEPHDLLLIGGSSRIPFFRKTVAKRILSPKHLNRCPDEVVALGSAMVGSGGEKNLLIDVLSQSLGVIAFDGTPVPLMKKGQPLPAKASKAFQAVGSGSFRLSLFQGDINDGRKCRVIASLELRNVDEGERIELDFSVDNGGLLQVKALLPGGRIVTIAPLDLGMSDSRQRCSYDIDALEKEVARISFFMSSEQQERVSSIFRQAKLLRDMEPHLYEEVLQGVSRMTSSLKDVISP